MQVLNSHNHEKCLMLNVNKHLFLCSVQKTLKSKSPTSKLFLLYTQVTRGRIKRFTNKSDKRKEEAYVAKLGGLSPVSHAVLSAPRTKSSVPPLSNRSPQLSQFLSQLFPFSLTDWTKKLVSLPPVDVIFTVLEGLPRVRVRSENQGEAMRKMVVPVIGYRPSMFQMSQDCIAPLGSVSIGLSSV